MEGNNLTMRTVILSAMFLLSAGNVSALSVWDEGLNGDLSTDPLTPTTISFSAGDNEIIGSVQSPGDTRDYFTFTLLAGQQLVGIHLLNYTDLNTSAPGNRGFHAIIAGATSFVPSGATADNFLGGNHLDATNDDLLSNLAISPLAGDGFSTPLGAGIYTYLVQQTGPQLTGYEINFQVVPLPAIWPLFAAAFAVIGFSQRRRSV